MWPFSVLVSRVVWVEGWVGLVSIQGQKHYKCLSFPSPAVGPGLRDEISFRKQWAVTGFTFNIGRTHFESLLYIHCSQSNTAIHFTLVLSKGRTDTIFWISHQQKHYWSLKVWIWSSTRSPTDTDMKIYGFKRLDEFSSFHPHIKIMNLMFTFYNEYPAKINFSLIH